jgi:chemotaxis protein MotB
MSPSLRPLLAITLAALSLVPAGCCCKHLCSNRCDPVLRQSQLRALQMHQNGAALALERDRARRQAAELAARNLALEGEAARLASDLDISHQRLANLASERSSLHEKYVGLLKKANEQGSPLSPGTTHRFEELARRYPEFEFDPATGVSKFHSDVLFDTGSDVVKPGAHGMLQEFAQIMNAGDAQALKILVVGHTDDRPINPGPTQQRHPTNWHLSTDRADSVVLKLEKFGIHQQRMGAAGYSMFQPVAANDSDHSRQANRRVEIFVLAPDAVIAGWDPANVQRR